MGLGSLIEGSVIGVCEVRFEISLLGLRFKVCVTGFYVLENRDGSRAVIHGARFFGCGYGIVSDEPGAKQVH